MEGQGGGKRPLLLLKSSGLLTFQKEASFSFWAFSYKVQGSSPSFAASMSISNRRDEGGKEIETKVLKPTRKSAEHLMEQCWRVRFSKEIDLFLFYLQDLKLEVVLLKIDSERWKDIAFRWKMFSFFPRWFLPGRLMKPGVSASFSQLHSGPLWVIVETPAHVPSEDTESVSTYQHSPASCPVPCILVEFLKTFPGSCVFPLWVGRWYPSFSFRKYFCVSD